MLNRAREFGVDDLDMNISVIPNRVYKFDDKQISLTAPAVVGLMAPVMR